MSVLDNYFGYSGQWKCPSRFLKNWWLLTKIFPYYFLFFLKNLQSSFRKMLLKTRVVSQQKVLMQYGFFIPMVKVFPKYPEEVFILSKVAGLQPSTLLTIALRLWIFFKNRTTVQIGYFWNIYRFYFSQYVVLENISASQLVSLFTRFAYVRTSHRYMFYILFADYVCKFFNYFDFISNLWQKKKVIDQKMETHRKRSLLFCWKTVFC